MTDRTVHLETVCDRIDYGFTASADFSVSEPRLLRITDIQDGSVDWNHVPGCRISPEEEADKRLCAGDIVFARTGATTGKCFLIEYAPRAVFASYLIRLRATEEVLPHYLYAFFQSQRYWHQIKGAVRGAAQGGVNSTTLSSLVVPLPDLTEQKRISMELQYADRVRRARRYALELTDTFLPAAFIELFGDPQTNPNNWDMGTIDDVLVSSQYGTSQKSSSRRNGYPVLGMGNITNDGSLDLSELSYAELPKDEFERLALKPGDIIFNRTNSTELVGKTTYWNLDRDAVLASYLVRLRLKKEFLPEVFSALLNTRYFKNLFRDRCKKAVGQSNISPTLLREFPVFIPPLPLQKKFKDLVEQTERVRAVQREALRQAEHLFATLLDRAFKVS